MIRANFGTDTIHYNIFWSAITFIYQLQFYSEDDAPNVVTGSVVADDNGDLTAQCISPAISYSPNQQITLQLSTDGGLSFDIETTITTSRYPNLLATSGALSFG